MFNKSELFEKNLQYAEANFLQDDARHLRVDKNFIQKNFDLDGKLVLDFGSGMGGMSLWYAKNWDCRVHGIDIDPFHVAIAEELRTRQCVPLGRAYFEARDILERPLTAGYDFIFMNDVAEHIPLPVLGEILRQLAASLAPGGRIFVSYPPWQGPYASHVTRVTGLPWCQFLPQKLLLNWISRKNMPLAGERESDLLEAYLGLNHLTHDKLFGLAEAAGLRLAERISHSILSKNRLTRWLSPRIFPLHFLVSKEITVFEKA